MLRRLCRAVHYHGWCCFDNYWLVDGLWTVGDRLIVLDQGDDESVREETVCDLAERWLQNLPLLCKGHFLGTWGHKIITLRGKTEGLGLSPLDAGMGQMGQLVQCHRDTLIQPWFNGPVEKFISIYQNKPCCQEFWWDSTSPFTNLKDYLKGW